MRHAISRDLHESWDALRDTRAGPASGDVDPAAIRRVLASAFVLEATRGGSLRGATVLLSGTRVDALFGRPLRDGPFDRIWSVQSRDRAAALLDEVIEGDRPTVASARGGPSGRGEATLELMLLPLGPSGPRRWRVLGSLVVLSASGWVGQRPSAPLDLLTTRALRNPADRRGADAGGPVRVGRFTVHRGGRDRRTPAAAGPR